MNRERIENIIYVIVSMIAITLAIMAFVFTANGCSCKPNTIIRDSIITVVPDIIHDTVNAIEMDTVIIGNNIVNTDTIAIIKYYPKYKYFDYTIKPDTIRLLHTDTLQVVEEKVIETPFLSKIGIGVIGFVIAIIGFIILKLKKIL